jgi:Fe-S-cluster containining protein
VNPCAVCAASNESCCQNRQIVLTRKDVERIAGITWNPNFFSFEAPESDYLDQDDDPIWNILTLQSDGRRRILSRQSNHDCFFLSHNGCRLTLDVRPLICRIHPYMYIEKGLKGIDTECPIARRPDAAFVLEEIGMPSQQVEAWRHQLYSELMMENGHCLRNAIAPMRHGSTVYGP